MGSTYDIKNRGLLMNFRKQSDIGGSVMPPGIINGGGAPFGITTNSS
jgi:hypothetical protein